MRKPLPILPVLLVAVITVAGALAPAPLVAAELAGVTMSDSVDIDGTSLVLNGMGLRKKAIFKVYVAGLYLPAKESDAAAILAAEPPRRLVMEFVRKVSTSQLCGGWEDGLENNTPDASAEVREQFATLCSWMADVGSGDQLVFTFTDAGTEVEVKGTSEGTLSGADFARALFASWLGPEPPSDEFKEGLLGNG